MNHSGIINYVEPLFWQELNPDLHINDLEFIEEFYGSGMYNDAQLAELSTRMDREGYLQLPPLDWTLPISRLADCIKGLKAQGIPPMMCYIYDEFWAMHFRYLQVLELFLGPDIEKDTRSGIFYVDPSKDQAGLPPHRDRGLSSLDENGKPKVLTVWIPLTDATPLNGCMYILPKHVDKWYNDPQNDPFVDPVSNKTRHEDGSATLNLKFQHIRALPVEAGSVLIWNQNLVHWGAQTSPLAEEPRIAMSHTYMTKGEKFPGSGMLLNMETIPGFDTRIQLLAHLGMQFNQQDPNAEPAFFNKYMVQMAGKFKK